MKSEKRRVCRKWVDSTVGRAWVVLRLAASIRREQPDSREVGGKYKTHVICELGAPGHHPWSLFRESGEMWT